MDGTSGSVGWTPAAQDRAVLGGTGAMAAPPPPTPMPTPILSRDRPLQIQRVELAIAGETDPVRSLCLAAEHASLLARHGYQSEADEALAAVRRRHDLRPHPVATPLVNLADAIVTRYTLGTSHAIVKMRRAHAIAQSARHAPTRALVAAWLGHCLWNLHDLDGAVPFLREALDLAQPDDHKTRSRACLVVAEIVALSGDTWTAERWFTVARRHASDAGDDATKSALAYNLLTVQAQLLRDAVLGGLKGALPRKAELHDAISTNLDRALGVRVDDLTLRIRAELMSLLGRPAEALARFEQRRRLAPALAPTTAHRSEPVWAAHEGWCLFRLDRAPEAAERVMSAVAGLSDATQVDDAAAVHAIAARVLAAADAPAAERHQVRAAEGWARYEAFQAKCLAAVEAELSAHLPASRPHESPDNPRPGRAESHAARPPL